MDQHYFLYEGDATREISFPLGGIGSGSIGLAGNGSLIDWEIFNHPSKGSRNGWSHFAVKAERGGKLLGARCLQGDLRKDFVGQYGSPRQFNGYGYGPVNTSMEGYPHFRKTSFDGRFPIAQMTFGGEDFPAELSLTAFNPMIPGETDDSSIPAAFFEISFKNTSDLPYDATVAFSVRNPFASSENRYKAGEGMHALFLKDAAHDASDKEYGDLTMATDAEDVSYQEYWYRGGWNDGPETYWRNLTECSRFPARHYEAPGSYDMATLAAHFSLAAGEEKKVRFLLSWNVPNNYNYWAPHKDAEGKDITWKNYYAVLFPDSCASARYALANFKSLYARTEAFRDSLYDQTLPNEVIDAAAATLSVLKSPTVLRLEDGSFYGWEGSREVDGSCEGCCTHVWNYAYALCFLFPDLERSLRENDYKYNQRENGKMEFRMTLPAGSEKNLFRACVDGQMGGIVKVYREWKISGDTEWLKSLWPSVKKALSYAWDETNVDKWDADKDGFLEGRQHHTLDMELFSASSWLESMYLAALRAAEEMAKALGDPDEKEYRALYESGREKLENELYNGEYYFQKIDLSDKSLVERFTVSADPSLWNEAAGLLNTYWNDEAGEIKYQIGEGSEIDQMLGEWHANLVGLGDIFDPERCRTALRSLMKYNYKDSFRDFYNPFRLFAVNDDKGTVMCDYPEGAKKPAIPVPYCQETMHGFEYALAGLLYQKGMLEEGTKVVKAVRDRYRGDCRNPWNEIECGNNYARSMAAFALPVILSGFTFDMTKKEIGFAPKLAGDFKSFFALGKIAGSYEQTETSARLSFLAGSGALQRIVTPLKGALRVTLDGNSYDCASADGSLELPASVSSSLVIEKI